MQQSLSDSRSASLPITGPVRVIGPGIPGRELRGKEGGKGKGEGGERAIKGRGKSE